MTDLQVQVRNCMYNTIIHAREPWDNLDEAIKIKRITLKYAGLEGSGDSWKEFKRKYDQFYKFYCIEHDPESTPDDVKWAMEQRPSYEAYVHDMCFP